MPGGRGRLSSLGGRFDLWAVAGLEGWQARGDHCRVFWPLSSLAVTDRRNFSFI